MNGLTFIPLLAVVFMGMITKKAPAIAAKTTLISGIVIIAIGYFIPPFAGWVNAMGQFHFVACVFVLMLATMAIWGKVAPMPIPYEEKDAKVTDLTPWKYLTPVSIGLLVIVALIYASFADFSVFSEGKPKYPTVQKVSSK